MSLPKRRFCEYFRKTEKAHLSLLPAHPHRISMEVIRYVHHTGGHKSPASAHLSYSASGIYPAKLISPTSFRVRRGHTAGSFVECVDFTDAGLHLFIEYAGQKLDDGLRERLINSLMSYAAIDTGNGIVARRSAIEGALEIDDDAFLLRLRSITVGNYSFTGYEAGVPASLAERFEILEYVTGWDGERTGAEIVQLGVQQLKT